MLANINGLMEQKTPFDVVGAEWSTIHAFLGEFDLDKGQEIPNDILY